MNGCKLDLTVWKLEIWPVTLMGYLPQKVHARHKECAHSTTKSQDYCANYWVIISAVVFAVEKQRKNTGPSEKCASKWILLHLLVSLVMANVRSHFDLLAARNGFIGRSNRALWQQPYLSLISRGMWKTSIWGNYPDTPWGSYAQRDGLCVLAQAQTWLASNQAQQLLDIPLTSWPFTAKSVLDDTHRVIWLNLQSWSGIEELNVCCEKKKKKSSWSDSNRSVHVAWFHLPSSYSTHTHLSSMQEN